MNTLILPGNMTGKKAMIRTLESGVNVSPCGKTNFPCSSSVAIILGEKNVIRQPRNSQSLEFETVEVISRDSVSLSADLKKPQISLSM
jgi:hypothetical protein